MGQWVWAVVAGALVVVAVFGALARLRRRRRRRQVLRGYEATIAGIDTSYHLLQRGLAALAEGDYERAFDCGTRAINRRGPGSYGDAAGHAIAGQAAARLGRARTAATHLTAALHLEATGSLVPSRTDLLRMLAAAKLALCAVDEAVDLAREAAAEARSDDELVAAVLTEGAAHLMRGDTSQARFAAETAAKQASQPDQRAAIHLLLGRVTAVEGSYTEADRSLLRAADLYTSPGDGVRLAEVLCARADLAEQRGETIEALDLWRRACRILLRHPTEHVGLATVFARIAACAAEAGELADVDRYLLASEAEFAQCEFPSASMVLLWTRARVAEMRGQQHETVSLLGEALLKAEQLGLGYWRNRMTVEAR